MPTIAAVILAAGCSQRMQACNKLLQPVKGKPMIRWAVEAALQSQLVSATVVTGFESDKITQCLSDLSVNVVHNSQYSTGMASSLRKGVASLSDIDGVLVMLADMPFVNADHINTLIRQVSNSALDQIIVPTHSGCRGNPVLWPKVYFSQLLTLTGDTGARSLLKKYTRQLCEVPLHTDAIFFDIDTAEIFATLSE